MLGVTDRDRDEIRIGRNRAIGARYSMVLFWWPIWVRLFGIGLAAVAVIFVAVKVHDVWVGGFGDDVARNAPLALLGLVFLGMFVALGWPRNTRRRRHRRRRR